MLVRTWEAMGTPDFWLSGIVQYIVIGAAFTVAARLLATSAADRTLTVALPIASLQVPYCAVLGFGPYTANPFIDFLMAITIAGGSAIPALLPSVRLKAFAFFGPLLMLSVVVGALGSVPGQSLFQIWSAMVPVVYLMFLFPTVFVVIWHSTVNFSDEQSSEGSSPA